jgi:serine/threonine protein kinase
VRLGTDDVALASGVHIGSYEIRGALGVGGMGEVYRARDTRLHRDVALKILPERFASDPDRLARFHREAHTLASLSHPNIGAIHGLEEDSRSKLHALVLELIEGPTLADRLVHGPLSLDEAVPIARQLVDALDAAHEKAVIHRDLKPSNIKVRDDGTVKVLDFGLAKMLDASGAADASLAPTITSPAVTGPGVVLGTAAYMAPEQARGKMADARADIWAFGVVLYEMLTGVRPFEGETVSEVISEVLKSEPDWTRIPAETPPALRRLLRRCLHKDRGQRLRAIADARFDLNDGASESVGPGLGASASRNRERWLLVGALAVATAFAVLAGARLWRQATAVVPLPESRLEISTARSTGVNPDLAISPDGSQVVYSAVVQGQPSLWLRSLNSVDARQLPGTDNAYRPFWSADSRSVFFFAGVQLKTIELDGGSIRTLARAPLGFGGTANGSRTILFAATLTAPLSILPAGDRAPRAATSLAPGQVAHSFPSFLPDNRHYVYVAQATDGRLAIYTGSIDDSSPRHLIDAEAAAFHALSERLLFLRQGMLFSQPFDPNRLELNGRAELVAEGVAAFSVSDAGPIVYRTTAAPIRRQFVWYDRTGRSLGSVGDPDAGEPGDPDLSPDGRYIAMSRTATGNRDIWLLEVARGLLTRFTTHPATDVSPRWSPDGTRIVFDSNRENVFDLYVKPLANAATEERILRTTQSKSVTQWTSNDQFMIFRSVDPETSHDLWALPLRGDKTPFPLVRGDFVEAYGHLSPDGKWFVYHSDESGRTEIYVRPFRGAGAPIRISTAGGGQMRWRRDGRELIYVALDGRLMAVPIQVSADGSRLDAGTPVALFATQAGESVPLQGGYNQRYMMTPDASRFLISTIVGDESVAPITVIQNWRPSER